MKGSGFGLASLGTSQSINHKLYPICHESSESLMVPPLWVDPAPMSVHFWDPMQDRVNTAASLALDSAAMPRAFGMMMITAITTTTQMRGAIG